MADKKPKKTGGDSTELKARIAQLEHDLKSLTEKVVEHTASILIDEEELRRDVVSLEKRLAEVEERSQELHEAMKEQIKEEAPHPAFGPDFLVDKMKGLQDRMKQMEDENRSLVELVKELRAQNEEISNLYVAKYRLDATIHPNEVMTIVEEILSELIGAKQFGILMLDQKKKLLRLAAGREVDGRLPGKTVPTGEGIIGDVATTGKPFFFEPTDSSEKQHPPLATIPLKMNESIVGVVVIYQLLEHKSRLTPIDHQLLELVAEHAPKTLLSAHLLSHRQTKSGKV
jgi:hypothetical protein